MFQIKEENSQEKVKQIVDNLDELIKVFSTESHSLKLYKSVYKTIMELTQTLHRKMSDQENILPFIIQIESFTKKFKEYRKVVYENLRNSTKVFKQGCVAQLSEEEQSQMISLSQLCLGSKSQDQSFNQGYKQIQEQKSIIINMQQVQRSVLQQSQMENEFYLLNNSLNEVRLIQERQNQQIASLKQQMQKKQQLLSQGKVQLSRAKQKIKSLQKANLLLRRMDQCESRISKNSHRSSDHSLLPLEGLAIQNSFRQIIIHFDKEDHDPLLQSKKHKNEPHIKHSSNILNRGCCNCKNTKCNENFCQCFSKGKKCRTDCFCYNCKNIDPNVKNQRPSSQSIWYEQSFQSNPVNQSQLKRILDQSKIQDSQD